MKEFVFLISSLSECHFLVIAALDLGFRHIV